MTKNELDLITKIIETFKQIPGHSQEMFIPFIRDNNPELNHLDDHFLITAIKARLYGDAIESKVIAALGKNI
ncbi:MAG: hypothetical protein Q7U04_02835 [Bacteriovorax sp.]|nr:hypothetical protein [Bacteriovorax sp.]